MAMSIRMKKEPSPVPVPTYKGATKEFILAGIQSADNEVVFGTLKQIEQFGPNGAATLGYLPEVLKVIEAETCQQVRVAALAAIGKMKEVAVAEVEWIMNLFEDSDPVVACAAISAIGTMGSAAVEHAPEIMGFLQDEDPEFRAAAAEALGTIKAWMYGDELAKCLDDPEVSVRAAVLNGIGALGEDAQLLTRKVVGFLNDASGALRLSAVKSLTSIGDAGEPYADKVAPLLADEDNAIREAALAYFKAAGKGGKRGADAASKSLTSSSGRTQAIAALALGYMEADEYTKDVAKLLSAEYKEDTSFSFSAAGVTRKLPAILRRPACAAATALAMMGDEGAAFANEVDALITEDSVPEAAGPMLRALGTMGAVSCEAKVRSYLAETSAPIREAACFALGEFGKVAETPESAKAVAERLADSNALVRQAAATALGCFKTQGPTFALEVVKLFGDKVDFVKVAAVKAMGEFGVTGQMYAAQVARMTFVSAGEAPIRVAACQVLAGMGDRGHAFAEDMVALLEDPDGDVREAALKALTKMGTQAAPFVPAITKACSDPLEKVRAAADECTMALGE